MEKADEYIRMEREGETMDKCKKGCGGTGPLDSVDHRQPKNYKTKRDEVKVQGPNGRNATALGKKDPAKCLCIVGKGLRRECWNVRTSECGP